MPDVGSWALERIGAAEQVGAVESKPVERLWMTLALGLWVFGGYFVVGLAMDPSRATTLFTRVDDWIPFDVTWVLIYAGVYSSMGYPLFVVRCQRLFRRVALAYFVVGGLATATFVAYPVMSIPLRPDVAVLDVSTFTGWGMRLNYFLDPPYNCFPSLHMAVATLAGLVAWKARPLWGVLGLIGAALIGVAICAVKQHYFLDGVGGAALALAAYLALVHGYDRAAGPAEEVAYSWRGPAGYAVCHAGMIGGFYLLFLLGWTPWSG